MDRGLLILGAGQYGMVAKEVAESMNCFDKIDFLDDKNPIAVGKLCEYGGFSTDMVMLLSLSEIQPFDLSLSASLMTQATDFRS